MSGKRAIFITGSGKCGTSVVAHSFYSAGFPMGPQSELVIYEGSRGNINGYWEHREMLEINQRILALNSADWHAAPSSLPLQLDSNVREQMRILSEKVPDGFCCKEPRLVWTADLWAEWFPSLTLVAVFRNPSGFRRSIAHVWPEEFSAGGGDDVEFRIWAAANRRLLDLANRFLCYWVSFDEPVHFLKERLSFVIGQMGKTFDPNAFDAFYIPEERRFSSPADIEKSTCQVPAPIASLYQELTHRAGCSDRSGASGHDQVARR